MTTPLTFILIPVEGPVTELTVDTQEETYDAIRNAVAGDMQIIGLPTGHCGYLNEEGKLLGMKPNPRATALASGRILPGDFIAGPLLVVGPADEEGNETSVDPEKLKAHLSSVLGI